MNVTEFCDGKNEFMCTSNVQCFIRDDKLIYIVYQRSMDGIFGYPNDYAWQKHVYDKLLKDLQKTYPNLKESDIIWNAASLQIYERHFDLVQ